MTAVFERILEMSLTAAVVIAVVVLIRLCLRKVPRKYAYALWSVAAFRLVCPVSFKSVFSIFQFTGTVKQTKIRQTIDHTILDLTYDVGASPAPAVSTPPITMDTPAPGVSVPPTVNVELLPEPEVVIDWASATMDIAAVVWMVGLAALLIYGVVSYVRLRRRMNTAIVLEGNVWQSDRVQSPFILGFVRPKIYLPFGLNADQQRYVLAHERYHLRRLDHIVRPLSFLILAAHWFNPLVWVAYYMMGRDMEMSCDEKVLSSGESVKAYSTTLLSFAANRRFPSPSPLAFGESGVKGRIKNALNWKKPRTWVTIIAIIVCVVVIVVCAANPVATSEAWTMPEWSEELAVEDVKSVTISVWQSDGRENTESASEEMVESLVSILNVIPEEEFKLVLDNMGTEMELEDWLNQADYGEINPEERAVRISIRLKESTHHGVLQCTRGQVYLSVLVEDTGEIISSLRWEIDNAALKNFIQELLEVEKLVPDENEPRFYQSVECLFMSSLSSALGTADSGYHYLVWGDQLRLHSKEQGATISYPAMGEWQELTDDLIHSMEWGTIVLGETNLWNVLREERPMIRMYGDDRIFLLLYFGDEMWVGSYVIDRNGYISLWDLYRLEDNTSGVVITDRYSYPIGLNYAPYESVEGLYLNPASSALLESDNGEVWYIGSERVTIYRKANEDDPIADFIDVPDWWVITEEEWAAMFLSSTVPDISGFKTVMLCRLSEDYGVLYVDGELWSIRFQGSYVWLVHRMEAKEQLPAVSGEVLAKWQADLTHDGVRETITLTYREDWQTYYLTVESADGEMLWQRDAGLSHVGWAGFYLYEKDRKQYLMSWSPYGNTGTFSYMYEIFSLSETGEQILFTKGSFWYGTNTVEETLSIDVEGLKAFEAEVNSLLEDTIVLIDTNEGMPYYSTQNATLCKLWAAPTKEVQEWKQSVIDRLPLVMAYMELEPTLLASVEKQVAIYMGDHDLAYVEQVKEIGQSTYRVTFKPGDYDGVSRVTWQDSRHIDIVMDVNKDYDLSSLTQLDALPDESAVLYVDVDGQMILQIGEYVGPISDDVWPVTATGFSVTLMKTDSGSIALRCRNQAISGLDVSVPVIWSAGTGVWVRNGEPIDNSSKELPRELVTPDTLPTDPEEYYLVAALPESNVYLYAKNRGEDSMLLWNGNFWWPLKGRAAHTSHMNLPRLYLLNENAQNTTVAAISERDSGTGVSIEQLVVYVMGVNQVDGSNYTGLRQSVYDWSSVHEAFNKKNTLVYDADTNSFTVSWNGKNYNSVELTEDMGQSLDLEDGYTGSLWASGDITKFTYLGGNRFTVTVKTAVEGRPMSIGTTGLDLTWTVEFNGEGFDLVGEIMIGEVE